MKIDEIMYLEKVEWSGCCSLKSFGVTLAHVDKYDSILLRAIKHFADNYKSKHIVLCKCEKEYKEIVEYIKHNLLKFNVEFKQYSSVFKLDDNELIIFKVSNNNSLEHIKSLSGQKFTKITVHNFDSFSSNEYDIIRTLTGCFSF